MRMESAPSPDILNDDNATTLELGRTMGEDGQNSGPMQEDLVQIAVNFLSIAMDQPSNVTTGQTRTSIQERYLAQVEVLGLEGCFRRTQWFCKEINLYEEVTAAAKSASSVAADLAKASMGISSSKNKGVFI
ncbi:hypothetical protein WN944_020329 [Citrus x changshan-huyou]|uniref:Uncharacterized protein n=1 Tax=Citrus x changshan-huyou TaxID=2935761 RepID=A0AAP0M392_9ROSI